jgi:hypothetical protein
MALDNFTIAESNDSGSSQAPLTKTGQDFGNPRVNPTTGLHADTS